MDMEAKLYLYQEPLHYQEAGATGNLLRTSANSQLTSAPNSIGRSPSPCSLIYHIVSMNWMMDSLMIPINDRLMIHGTVNQYPG